MDIICCPTCKTDLVLSVTEKNDVEILEGTLTCSKCGFKYPINDGIPNLLPQDLQEQ